jgi:hypothetical protein
MSIYLNTGMTGFTEQEASQGFVGALGGAATGAAVGTALGGPGLGTVAGAAIGGGLALWQAQQGTRSRKKAQEQAEQARIRAVTKEMGARQQAENLATAGLRNTGRRSSGSSGGVSAPQGFIGQNLPTTAGTF